MASSSDPIDRLKAALKDRYSIERELGEGGMATVYLAQDLRHEREVALKLLKPDLAAVIGAERFLAEIKTTANLQHPHILPLFDSGQEDGFLYYVMPFVEGESLREKLDRERQLSVDEALHITKAVASALQYAHDRDVIHRDIKPENILLHAGQPVVADFGIALALSAAGGGRMTETGLSLGTPHYMSPEQASADRDLSARSDVYSLACVLYEMLAGDPPHTGPTAQAILMRILTEEPRSVTDVRKAVPPNVQAVLVKALEKLPADRFGTAEQFAAALENESFAYARRARKETVAESAPVVTSPPAEATYPRVLTAAAVAALALFAAWGWLRPAAVTEYPATRAPVTGLEMDVIQSNAGTRLAISPDGRRIVAGGQSEGLLGLFIRSSDVVEWRELPNTEGGTTPTFSPDGEWVAFRSGNDLLRVPISGGPGLPVAEDVNNSGLHWGANNTIVFTDEGNLYRVAGFGGIPELLLEPDSFGVAKPHMLPDGSGVLFSTSPVGGPVNGRILLYDLETEAVTELVPSGNRPKYVPTGHIVYGHGDQALMAVRFDLDTHDVGPPTTVIPELSVFNGGAAQFDVSPIGTLIYNAASNFLGPAFGNRALVEVELDGTVTPLDLSPGTLINPVYSPDGTKIAYEDGGEIRVYDEITGASPQLTDGGGSRPVWSPGGEYIYFASNRSSTLGLDGFRRRWDGSFAAEQLFGWERNNWVVEVSEGDSILIVRNTGPPPRDLLLMRMGPEGSVPDSTIFEAYLTAEWDELNPRISPDGRFVAYTSDQEGEYRVYVQAFPVPLGRQSVSPGPGSDPQWAPDGRTLYYRDGVTFLAVDVTTDPSFAVASAPRRLFDHPAFAGTVAQRAAPYWDIHPEGNRFILTEVRGSAEGAAQGGDEFLRPRQRLQDVYIVTNWFTELRELMGDP